MRKFHQISKNCNQMQNGFNKSCLVCGGECCVSSARGGQTKKIESPYSTLNLVNLDDLIQSLFKRK